MAEDPLARPTVLTPPTGAHVLRDRIYRSDARGDLHLDAYRPAFGAGPWPAVLLVNGDAEEAVIAHAKDWGVYRSYGEHLAARGIVGVPFDHRSSATVGRAEVAAEVAAALAYIREYPAELGVDPERIGLWAFSAAGAFALSAVLRDRPAYLLALAGFYTVWDLAPFRDSSRPPSEEDIRRWSATEALGDTSRGLPPIFIAVAGRDNPALVAGAERFVARAHEIGADVRVTRHPSGQHGFDVRDDDDRSREIIASALAFFTVALARGRSPGPSP